MMKLRTTLAALTAASLCLLSYAAQAQSSPPPTPRPAAGALPPPNANPVQKSFRTQTSQEQQFSSTTPALDPGQAGHARVAQTSAPPIPRPAAGALPQLNPNAVQKSFRTQTSQEQQSSATTSPVEVGQSGRTR